MCIGPVAAKRRRQFIVSPMVARDYKAPVSSRALLILMPSSLLICYSVSRTFVKVKRLLYVLTPRQRHANGKIIDIRVDIELWQHDHISGF